MRETSAAKTALADYKAMGPGRSLEKLAERYQQQQNSSEVTVPTRLLRTLCEWSRQHGWVAQAEAQDRAEDEKVLREKAAQREKARENSLTLVRLAKHRIGGKLAEDEYDLRGMKDLAEAIKLEMALLGEPLAEKLEVEHSGSIGTTDERSPAELAEYHRRQAAKYGGVAPDSADG